MKTVSIVGIDTRFIGRYFQTDEVWTCNRGYNFISPITKLFVMHKQHIKDLLPAYDWGEMFDASIQGGFDIITLHKIPELPSSEHFPLKEIIEMFGTDYFTSTVCYQIAYALYGGFNEIHLHGFKHFNGVSKITDDLCERCGEEFWAGIAIGKGIKVVKGEYTDFFITRDGKRYAEKG